MNRFKLLIILLHLISATAHAQILNIEKAKLDADTAKFVIGNITTSFSLNNRSAASDAPVNLLGFKFKSSFALFPGRHRISIINDFDYLKINDAPFLNTGYQHIRMNFWRDRKVQPEAYVQFQYDNFRGLFPRILSGVAMRHRLVEEKNVSFIFGVGLMHEYERWAEPYLDDTHVNMSLLKSANYVIFRWQISKVADLNTINFYQVGYDARFGVWRHRISNETNINSQITERLSLTATFGFGFEDKPIVPITQLIYNFSTGITFKL